jgi:tetratricopeptide (TPR) repeat protein
MKAIELEQNTICAYEGLGEYYWFIRDYKKALLNYKKVAELQPENKEIYREIGKAYIKLNRQDMAKEAFAVFLKDHEASADYSEVYQFTRIDRIRTLSGETLLSSKVKWRIVDPVVYEGAVGYFKGAEMRIKDVYEANLHRFGSIVQKADELLSTKSIKDIIIRVNDYSIKHFGSEVISIHIDIEK